MWFHRGSFLILRRFFHSVSRAEGRKFLNGRGKYCSTLTSHWHWQMIHRLWRTQTLPAQHIYIPITICHMWVLPTVLKKGFVLCIFCRKCNKLHTEQQNKNSTWLFYWIFAYLLGKTSLQDSLCNLIKGPPQLSSFWRKAVNIQYHFLHIEWSTWKCQFHFNVRDALPFVCSWRE